MAVRFFVIRQQALKGKWIFKLKAIYTIGILDFVFDEDKDDEEYYHHVVKLMDVEKKKSYARARINTLHSLHRKK